MVPFRRTALPVLCGLLAAGPVQAGAEPAAYAILVGSNRAGPGQRALQHAHDDAARVREVMEELGGFDPARVRTLADPGRDALLTTLDQAAATLAGHRARGEDAVFLFYYSGHAKAQALNLGPDELPLPELKARLEALQATVTLVVLDACQAGALSQVKGASPAADFSWNASAGLSTEGMAVLASSSATELSQESATLGGSYFTHHLVTGLRGAADQDGDGRVTLGEAYSYAYNRTLVSTAATAVGSQHVTLETELRGKGDMVLTRPGQASAQLLLDPELAAEILVHREDSGVVVAELHKAAGGPLGLALVPGRYRALVRQGDALRDCAIELPEDARLALDPSICTRAALETGVAAKSAEDPKRPLERLMIEGAIGAGPLGDSAYTARLEDFGFSRGLTLFGSVAVLQGALVWTFHPHLAAVLTAGDLDSDAWSRELYAGDDATRDEVFRWVTWRTALQLRAGLPLAHGWLVPYAQAGAGPAWASTVWEDETGDTRDYDWGWNLGAAGGLQLMPTVRGWRHLGAFAQVEQTWAPVLENLIGDRHQSGRFTVVFGLRAGF